MTVMKEYIYNSGYVITAFLHFNGISQQRHMCNNSFSTNKAHFPYIHLRPSQKRRLQGIEIAYDF